MWRAIANLPNPMRLHPALATAAAIFALAGVASAQCVIEGRVELPKPKGAPVANLRYSIIAKSGVLQPDPPLAVVYLVGTFPKGAAPATVQMAQKDLAFNPPLLAVQVGTKVEFPNFDDTYHNIFSYSPTKRFDLGRYRPDEKPTPSQVFEKAGLVTLHCDIHEHMRALILVLETPHFTKSNPDGQFRLAGIPPGSYVLKAWLNSRTTLEKRVEVRSGQTLRVDFP